MVSMKFRLMISAVMASCTLAAAVVGVAALTGGSSGNTAAMADPTGKPGDQKSWLSSWITSPQAPSEKIGENWSKDGFDDHTVRQVIRPTVGGDQARITLSNLFGSYPVNLTAATVGLSAGDARVDADSIQKLTFGGETSSRIPSGKQLVSDPAPLNVEAFQPVTVTLYFSGPTGPTTFHDHGFSSTWLAKGDRSGDTGADNFTHSNDSWYYLTDMEVRAKPRGNGVAAIGDSIVNGSGSLVNGYHRFPDLLADRLKAAGKQRAVLNAGISGNRLVNSSSYFGESVTQRFQRDALSKTGVGTVILLAGVNDVGHGGSDPKMAGEDGQLSAAPLIEGYRELIEASHGQNLKIIGGTLLPFEGADYHSPSGEKTREKVNEWIRTSGEFDGVIDFAKVMADPDNGKQLRGPYDSGDKLHPSNAGYSAMAEAVDLKLFE